jgi:hypothetical protein
MSSCFIPRLSQVDRVAPGSDECNPVFGFSVCAAAALLTAALRLRYRLHNAVEVEAAGFLARRELLEAFEPPRDEGGRGRNGELRSMYQR